MAISLFLGCVCVFIVVIFFILLLDIKKRYVLVLTFIFVVVIFILVIFNLILVNRCSNLSEKNRVMRSQVKEIKSDLDFYIETGKLKKEVFKKHEENEKGLNSGDVHSRNSAAADILRNN